MTEAEAKTKWCPMVRAWHAYGEGGLGIAGASINTERPVEAANCIGSACMMWRYDRWDTKGHPPVAEAVGDTGYCGLAGKT